MKRPEIGIALTRLVADWAAGTVTDLPGALRGLASDIDGEPGQLQLDGDTPPDPVVVLGRTVHEIFNHWRVTTRRDARSRLTPERDRAVRTRLKQGYTPEQLKRAIDGCAASPFHNGTENGQKHDDLELICRNGSNVERFAEMAPSTSRPAPTKMDRELKQLRQDLQHATDLSDHEWRDRCQKAIAEMEARG